MSIVKNENVKKENMEGKPLIIIKKYLDDNNIVSKTEAVNYYNKYLLEVMDICNEIKYEFNFVEITYKKYRSIKSKKFTRQSEISSDLCRYISVYISYNKNKDKNLLDMINETIDRCLRFGVKLLDKYEFTHSTKLEFYVDYPYRYYQFWYNNGIKLLTLEIEDFDAYNLLINDIDFNLRSQLREVGYGILHSKCLASTDIIMDSRIELFKLKIPSED